MFDGQYFVEPIGYGVCGVCRVWGRFLAVVGTMGILCGMRYSLLRLSVNMNVICGCSL